MISPKELRAAGVSEDEIVDGVAATAGISREKAVEWVAALDRGEEPWVDVREEDPERGRKLSRVE